MPAGPAAGRAHTWPCRAPAVWVVVVALASGHIHPGFVYCVLLRPGVERQPPPRCLPAIRSHARTTMMTETLSPVLRSMALATSLSAMSFRSAPRPSSWRTSLTTCWLDRTSQRLRGGRGPRSVGATGRCSKAAGLTRPWPPPGTRPSRRCPSPPHPAAAPRGQT